MKAHVGLIAVLAIAAVSVISGCESGTASAQHPAHLSSLTLAFNDDGSDAPEDPALLWFTKSVAEVSKGKLTIKVDYNCCGSTATYEETLVSDVAHSKFNLGWVATRALGNSGVTSVEALNAPMLINSYGVEQAVFDSSVPKKMLSGFKPAGVTGLAIEPGFLREPIHQGSPLLGASDWSGITFATVPSNENAQSLADLGALVKQPSGSARDDALADGQISGFDNSFEFASTAREPSLPVLTGNVVLWPRDTALVASPALMLVLTAQQHSWLTSAAAATAKRVSDLEKANAAAVAPLCGNNAKIATASPAELASLRQAFAPEYTLIEKNSATKTYIMEIQKLKKAVPADSPLLLPAGCAYTG
jgi:TRAP-type C4-dicarboxylate transport system substrate-binding protein